MKKKTSKIVFFLAFLVILAAAGFYFSGVLKFSLVSLTGGCPVSYFDYARGSWVTTWNCVGNDYDVNWNPAATTYATAPSGKQYISTQVFKPSINGIDFGTVIWQRQPLSISDGGIKIMENDKIQINATFLDIYIGSGGQLEPHFGGASINTKGVYSKLQLSKSTCSLEAGDFVAGETFAAGTAVSLSSFRYPVKSFCFSNQILVTDSASMTSYQSKQEYVSLVEGSTVTVPAGKTMTFFYVLHQTSDLPIVSQCSQGYWDANAQACLVNVTTGFIYVCSQGQFDPQRGLCVVQPESTLLCSEGYYDTVSQKCIINPPVTTITGQTQVVCDKGTWNGVSCVYSPDTTNVCSAGSYDIGLKKCVVNPETTTLEKADYSLYIIIGLIFVALIAAYWVMFMRKK